MKMFVLGVMGMLANVGLLKILFNSRGEAGAGGDGGDKGAGGDDKKFTQADIDRVVQDRLSRERSKYADYDDLHKFKTEHEKSTEAQKQKELEAQKKYEELKGGWAEKEKNFQQGLSAKDAEISNLKILHALNFEVSKLNAYPEAVDVLKGMVSLSENGTPQMDGKDSVGNTTKISLEEGVKKFLEERPHLVKANQNSGGGGTPPNTGAGGGSGTESLADLNAQLLVAQSRGDTKTARELKDKIQKDFSNRGVNRTM